MALLRRGDQIHGEHDRRRLLRLRLLLRRDQMVLLDKLRLRPGPRRPTRNDMRDPRRRDVAQTQRISTGRSRHSVLLLLLLHDGESRALRKRRRVWYDLDWYGDRNGYLEGLDGIGRDSYEGLLLLLLLDRPDCRYGRVRSVGVAWGRD